MSLSYDTARCHGQLMTKPFGVELHATCIDCQRRTDKSTGERQPWMQGVVADGVCTNKIKDGT
jgi:hypothetical protein